MKIKTNIITLLAALGILASCNDDIITPTITVGEADNAIILRAGMAEGGSGVQTRANDDPHVAFSSTTQMRLYVEGAWHGGNVTQYTNCTTGTADYKLDGTVNDTHPLGSYTPMLYWDDYGTANPDNTTSRANGLAVYGVAVEGLSALPDDLKEIKEGSWTSLAWSVNTNGADVLNKDIVVSNNHGDNSTPTKTGIKFTDRNDAAKNILIYQHMMSKVTFVLTAGEGFSGGKFTSTPEVILTRNLYNKTDKTEYCYTSGTVNVKDATATGSSVSPVKLQHKNTTDDGVVTEHALIYPGSCFGAENADIIARINADGNIYYVTAEKILAALTADTNHSDKNTKSGYNYVFNITIDKTEIHVTAAIKDWIDVTAETETPKIINLTADVGTATVDDNTKQRMSSFDFYLSDAAGSSATTAYEKKATANKPDEGADGSTIWTFADGKKLYWPNHQIHYFMRGVSPASTTVTGGKIAVSAGDYDAGTSPSNLLVGAPVIEDNTMCGNGDHTQVDMSTGGICAREGKVNLTFDYMMSQVEVRLTTAASGDSQVNLTNAKVEIIGGYTAGEVDIHNKTVTTSGSAADFEVGTEDTNYRHSIVVPQSLTDALKFKITIYKSGSTTDVDDIYYATIKNIKVTEPGDTAPKLIEKWDSGKHYVYTLYLEKTELKVTATITDWVTVTASDDVWF